MPKILASRGCMNEGDEMISVRLYHGGNLVWIPETQYLHGQVTIYILDPDEINMENLRLKTRALGYSGLKCLYYRIRNNFRKYGFTYK